jgi:hypothetical protein
MTAWKEGDIAIERLLLPSAAIQRGETYRLKLGLFHPASGARLPITDSGFPLTDRETAVIVSETAVASK